jgi:Ca-activated chloride channel family protein
MTDFANPHFAEPGWLWLAVLGPIALIALQRYSAWARQKQLARVAGPEVVKELILSHSEVRREIKNWLLVVAVAGGAFALARPQWGEQEDAWRLLGQDMVFVLDCSRSMLAKDVAPSRMQRAKLSILDYVQRHGKGRVGLIAFAGQAFLQCPLTFDYGAFEESLAAVDEKTIPVPGTDIGRALEEAFHAMDTTERQKLLVLLTDGEDLEKGGIKIAQSLAKKGVVVFTLGVGTPSGAEIQFIDERGQATLLRDSKGQPVRSRLDEVTLRGIATATRGAYYLLGPLGEGLEKVRVTVETENLGFGAAPARKLGVERFHVPIAVVLALLVLEPLMGTRRRTSQQSITSG